ncbi:CRISPR-associated endonuclease Cas1 [Methanomassiliicoccus luminyensis]|uniref:CRISPR-associated endonuclease Cas1 n=1 Tax=Methanomassiliicoccus luminyensis TaxID=1080712 RepID=UPI00037D35C6|nr:CRISPR-associated endonuclease Cas1 [Methanomassiliicoccus luminyensis]
MRTLYLSGHGVSLRVENARLLIRDGCEFERANPCEYELKPKYDEYDNIVIYGHSGNITLEALKWLSKQNIQLTILNWDGRLLASITIPEPKAGGTRLAQYQAFSSERRLEIARKIIDAKIRMSIATLDWMVQRYPELKDSKKSCFDELALYQSKLPEADSIAKIRGVEGMVARNYWLIVAETFDKKWEFEGRVFGKTGRPMAAVDPINALFNYGYSLIEAQCWRAINANGLDPYIGFVHETAPGKSPLAYDLQEPFRWMADVAVISALERNVFEKKDFIRTDNYVLRIRPEGVKKLLQEINSVLTSKVDFKGKSWEWGYVIGQKTGELADYIVGKRSTLDLASPAPNMDRTDSAELRQTIENMTYAQWQKMGFSKGTLHNLKKRAKSNESFRVYGKVRGRLGEQSGRT